MNGFKIPDVTPVQFVGIIAAIVNTLVAFGVDLSEKQQNVILADAGVVAALLFGDAVIRHGRSRVFQNPPKPPAGGETV